MRIAICEDMPEDARQLREVLTRYLEANSLAATVDCFGSGAEFLSAFEPGKYQIIFMDILMEEGGATGIDAAEKVARSDQEAALIFVTNSEEYSLIGYSFSVFYILKPIRAEKLAEAMKKCRVQIDRYAKTIEVIADRQPVKIRQRDIHCVQSQRRVCILSFKEGEVKTNMLLDTLAEMAGGYPFIRCHQSFIINLVHVTAMQKGEFLMENGQTIPISKAYRAASRQAFREYFFDRIQGRTV